MNMPSRHETIGANGQLVHAYVSSRVARQVGASLRHAARASIRPLAHATREIGHPYRDAPLAHRAFTIVELLIVLVVLAIAATLVVPLLATPHPTKLTAAAELIAADLGFAQTESITHADDPRVVTFNTSTSSWLVAKKSAPDTPITEPVTQAPYNTQLGTGRASQLAGVAIQSYSLGGDARLGFGKFGELDQTATATITLAAGGWTLVISVDPTSGEVSLGAPTK